MALRIPSKSQESKAIQWWSNVSSALLERLSCGAVNAASVVNDEICEELQEPFSSCNNAAAMAAATDDNCTVWSFSRVKQSRTRNVRNALNRFRSNSRSPLVNSDSSTPSSSEILHPPSSGGCNSNRSTPTRSSRITRRSGDEEARHPNTPSSHHQRLQGEFPIDADASCDTSTTASMNTRHTFEDSLDEDDENHCVGFDGPSLASSTRDLVKKRRPFYQPYVPRTVNNNYCDQRNRNTRGSPKSHSIPSPIFRNSVETPPRKLRSRTAGVTSPIKTVSAGTEIQYSAVLSPDRSTIPTDQEHNTRKKDVSTTGIEKTPPSLIRMGATHYFNAQPTSSISSISFRLRSQRKVWSISGDTDDDDSLMSDDSCSTVSSLSSGEHESHHQVAKKQEQTATNLRRLLMERKPLCVNQ